MIYHPIFTELRRKEKGRDQMIIRRDTFCLILVKMQIEVEGGGRVMAMKKSSHWNNDHRSSKSLGEP